MLFQNLLLYPELKSILYSPCSWVCFYKCLRKRNVAEMALCGFWGHFMAGDVNSTLLSLSVSLLFLSCRIGAFGALAAT